MSNKLGMLRIPKQENKFSLKRQNGVYKTPYVTARHMVEIILPFVTIKSEILEPSAGDGVFIQALIDSGVDPSQITAHDINKEKIQNLQEMGVQSKCVDTLLDNYTSMDIILGNPPYKSRRESTYMKKHRKEIEKKYGFIVFYNLYKHEKTFLLFYLKQQSFPVQSYPLCLYQL